MVEMLIKLDGHGAPVVGQSICLSEPQRFVRVKRPQNVMLLWRFCSPYFSSIIRDEVILPHAQSNILLDPGHTQNQSVTQKIMTTHHRTGRVPQSPTLSSLTFRTTWPFRVNFPDNRREDWPSEWIQSGWSDPAPSSRNKQSNQLHVKGMVLWLVCE